MSTQDELIGRSRLGRLKHRANTPHVHDVEALVDNLPFAEKKGIATQGDTAIYTLEG
jgi:hypothetical protein